MISFTCNRANTELYIPSSKIIEPSFFSGSTVLRSTSTTMLSNIIDSSESLSKIIDSDHTLEIKPITERLEKISSPLESKTLLNTFSLVREIISVSKSQKLWWHQPLINVSYDLDVVLEWWNNNKNLAFYINQLNTDYIKVWGADIDEEMEDGSINSVRDGNIGNLWQWISH